MSEIANSCKVKFLLASLLLNLLQIILHSDHNNNDGVEYNVPLVAYIRAADVGQRSLVMSRPAFLYAEDESHSSLLRDATAHSSVHLRHGSV